MHVEKLPAVKKPYSRPSALCDCGLPGVHLFGRDWECERCMRLRLEAETWQAERIDSARRRHLPSPAIKIAPRGNSARNSGIVASVSVRENPASGD